MKAPNRDMGRCLFNSQKSLKLMVILCSLLDLTAFETDMACISTHHFFVTTARFFFAGSYGFIIPPCRFMNGDDIKYCRTLSFLSELYAARETR